MTLNNNKSKNIKGNIWLFFFHPFAAFLLALSNLKSKSSFTVFLLFNILFGYTFIAQNKSADSYSYVQEFKATKRITSDYYLNTLKEYFTFDSNIKDIYTITSNFVVSRISENYHLLMALYAFVFSYFFLKSFRFFVDRQEFRVSYIVYSLAFLFVFSNSIFNINGVRFWTAAWIAVYACFEIVLNKKYIFLLLAIITPLFHISFFSFLGVLIIYLITIKYDKVWAVIFIVSFFVGNFSIELINQYSFLFPKAGQDMAYFYADNYNIQDTVSAIENLPIYAKVFNKLPYLFYNVIVFTFIINSKIFKSNKEIFSLYIFLLIWMSFSNFTMPIPSFGGRFFQLAIPFIMYLYLITYSKIPILSKLIYYFPIIFSYSIFQWLRLVGSVVDYALFYSVFPHIFIKNLF